MAGLIELGGGPVNPTEREIVARLVSGLPAKWRVIPNASLPALPAILADGAASGRYVYGDPITDWRDGLAQVTVELDVDGQLRRSGSGKEVMGDPLAPLLWLAETLRGRGLGIDAGEMISTGSTTGMLPVSEDCVVKARFGASAVVQIEFRRHAGT